MEKGIRVKDITAGSHISGVFAVKAAAQAQTRNGSPYWNLTLMDASGSMDAKIWHPLSAEFADIPAGSFVEAAGAASMYRDKCQLVIERMALLTEDERDKLCLAEFMPASPYAIADMYGQLRQLIDQEFTYLPWRQFLDGIFADEHLRRDFCIAPAATGVHHAYAGGLLEHTLSVTSLCRLLADKYPELDRQTLLAGAILHDIGKIRELSGGIALEYTQSGRLLGHIFLGLEIIAPCLEKSGLEPWLAEHLRHLILSHHGQLEFGAPRLPQTAEAFALHYADNLDAKLAQCRSLFTDKDEAPAWSSWQSALGRFIFQPRPTPAEKNIPALSCQELRNSAPEMDEYSIYYMDEEAMEPDAEELAEIYADPAFNAPPNPAAAAIPPGPAAQANRSNRRDSQCSLL